MMILALALYLLIMLLSGALEWVEIIAQLPETPTTKNA